MFFRSKQAGSRTYLQLVENKWEAGRARQRVIATVGRLDKVIESGELESLLRSGARFFNSSFSYFNSLGDEVCLSSHQVSQLLQVSPSTVISWVNRGDLAAFRTPGGHRRVKVGDLRRFLETSRMPVPVSMSGAPQPKRVLVVDDDPLVVRAIQRSIAHREDVVVEGCHDGIEALVLIGARQPDLVLLDIYMAGLDGFEVCRRLRGISHLQGLKIVAITAHPSEDARARILDHGASDYWVKPVTVEQIVTALAEAGEEALTA